MIKPNPNKEKFDDLTKRVEENDGYCPCLIGKNENTFCPCRPFVKKCVDGYKGECHCGRFINE